MSVIVPSRVPGADFQASLYAHWTPVDGEEGDQWWQHQARAVACDHLRAVTEKWAAIRLVRHCSAAELAINAELATPLVVSQPIPLVVHGWVKLVPASEHEVATEDYLRNLREERVRNDRVLDRLGFYDFVFADRERAWLWWVDQRPEKLQALSWEVFADLVGALESVRANRPIAGEAIKEDSFAQVIGDFIVALKPDHAALAIGLLRQYLNHFDRADLVDRVDLLSVQRQQRASGEDKQQVRDVPHFDFSDPRHANPPNGVEEQIS